MCIQNILIADSRLPEVRDAAELPGLTVGQIDTFSELAYAVRRIVRAPFLYSIGPTELCGCYFCYDREEHEAHQDSVNGEPPLSGETLRQAEWVWRQGHNSVNSFARYLTRHVNEARLALYVCWDGDEGMPLEQRRVVGPSFFGGSSFARLPENSLFIITDGVADQEVNWLDVPKHAVRAMPEKKGHSRGPGKRKHGS